MERVILFEIGSFAVKACEIELTRKPRPPLWLAHRTLPEGAHADPGVSGKVLRDLIKEVGTKTRRARAILSDPDLVVRSLDVPAQSEKEISVALGFAMTELLPLPLEELVVDYEGTLGRGGDPGGCGYGGGATDRPRAAVGGCQGRLAPARPDRGRLPLRSPSRCRPLQRGRGLLPG